MCSGFIKLNSAQKEAQMKLLYNSEVVASYSRTHNFWKSIMATGVSSVLLGFCDVQLTLPGYFSRINKRHFLMHTAPKSNAPRKEIARQAFKEQIHKWRHDSQNTVFDQSIRWSLGLRWGNSCSAYCSRYSKTNGLKLGVRYEIFLTRELLNINMTTNFFPGSLNVRINWEDFFFLSEKLEAANFVLHNEVSIRK